MEKLTVVGAENDALVLATESGERFSLPVDEVLRRELRRATTERGAESGAAKPSPRQIQAHIRSGMSAVDVAELLGARLEDVARFEGPVLAEREHVVGQALALPVLLGAGLEQDAPTFGAAIRAKLAEACADGERWTSWKEPSGWVVKLEFAAGGVDRDARWGFDPKHGTLAPQNAEATQLSRQGPLPEGLIPRLRALDAPGGLKDDSRFDSGAFGPRRMPEPEADLTSPEFTVPATVAVRDAAIKRAPEEVIAGAETADLLEALRRRRGQREPLPGTESAPERAHSPIALFDALEPGYDEIEADAGGGDSDGRHTPEQVRIGEPRRKGRTAMPSWDEIVFGARTDD